MIVEHLTIIQAWNELNKINNHIGLLETKIKKRFDISSSKLKEILIKCSIANNDKFINSIISNDEDIIKLGGLYDSKNAYETYIRNEIRIAKMSTPAICIAFLKEYYLKKDNKKMTWEDISKEMGYSVAQCRRYYDEYKGYTPRENEWHLEAVKSR